MRVRLASFFPDARTHRYESSEILLHEQTKGSDIFIVIKGYVFVVNSSASGEQSIHAIYGPGTVFPLRFAVNGTLPVASFEAFTDVEAIKVPVSEFRSTTDEAEASKALLDATLHQFGCYVRGVQVLEIKDATARVGQKLHDLAVQLGRETKQGHELPFSLTHEQLARLTKLSRETVTRSLQELREKDLILVERVITVPDLPKLQDFIEV